MTQSELKPTEKSILTMNLQHEPILVENPGRFVLFPIQHQDIWEFYKNSEACFGLRKK